MRIIFTNKAEKAYDYMTYLLPLPERQYRLYEQLKKLQDVYKTYPFTTIYTESEYIFNCIRVIAKQNQVEIPVLWRVFDGSKMTEYKAMIDKDGRCDFWPFEFQFHMDLLRNLL